MMGSQSEKPWDLACIRQLEVGSLCFITSLACILLFAGCPDSGRAGMDPPSMSGNYSGIYSVTCNYRDTARQVTNWNYILLTYDGKYCHIRIDPTRHTGYCFCRVVLEVTAGGWQPIEVAIDYAVGCMQCDESKIPRGMFVRETIGDSLILKQQVDSAFMMFRLAQVI